MIDIPHALVWLLTFYVAAWFIGIGKVRYRKSNRFFLTCNVIFLLLVIVLQ